MNRRLPTGIGRGPPCSLHGSLPALDVKQAARSRPAADGQQSDGPAECAVCQRPRPRAGQSFSWGPPRNPPASSSESDGRSHRRGGTGSSLADSLRSCGPRNPPRGRADSGPDSPLDDVRGNSARTTAYCFPHSTPGCPSNDGRGNAGRGFPDYTGGYPRGGGGCSSRTGDRVLAIDDLGLIPAGWRRLTTL